MPIVTFRRLLLLGLVIFLVAHPVPARALNLCGSACSCTVAATNISFTSGYNPLNGTAVMGTGTVTTSCQLLSLIGLVLEPYTLTLSKGLSGSYTSRQMQGPAMTKLGYNLYSDSGMTLVWGDGTGSSQTVAGSIQLSILNAVVPQIQTIYAQIHANQNVAVGSYTDTITVTLQF